MKLSPDLRTLGETLKRRTATINKGMRAAYLCAWFHVFLLDNSALSEPKCASEEKGRLHSFNHTFFTNTAKRRNLAPFLYGIDGCMSQTHLCRGLVHISTAYANQCLYTCFNVTGIFHWKGTVEELTTKFYLLQLWLCPGCFQVFFPFQLFSSPNPMNLHPVKMKKKGKIVMIIHVSMACSLVHVVCK